MTSWRMVRILAGFLVLLSLVLGASASPYYQNANWLWLAAFVGANLFQSGITQWCLSEIIMRKLGFKSGC